MKTPAIIISGYLGSGKTTLLLDLIEQTDRKLAILVNEFGELAVDGRVISGKNIRMTELTGGCVCCSLAGEFEAAVREIIQTVRPDEIVVETTGIAEPDALIGDLQDNIPELLIETVITVVDADVTARFPVIGHTGRLQIASADLLLVNKIDLVTADQLAQVRQSVARINPDAMIRETVRCHVDPLLLFGRKGRSVRRAVSHREAHQPTVESFELTLDHLLQREPFEAMMRRLPRQVFRAKGFVRLEEGCCLLNYVAGRYELTPASDEGDGLGIVFLGEGAESIKPIVIDLLEACRAEEKSKGSKGE